ncbi:cell wall transcription factor ACE2 [Podospora fimiseda]|uniref:Cell wall transcription factor ACE2 n=1 Tax=Podospora fimiseda TaxID=252190 RepID=A0AAN7BI71_9PEZI|nr:cell wall transcription factor ACE2 [Podospora fimiseda]
MSVVYEPRNFIHEGAYPPIDDHHHHHDPTPDTDRFTDPNDTVENELVQVANSFVPTPPPYVDTKEYVENAPEPPRMELGSLVDGLPPVKEPSPISTTPQRTKAIPKPLREETKNGEGKYICTWPSCTDDVKEFARKCEWNKHMDKHDRPYKCEAEGCEKLPGFTYSGGLLRHEREVHGKHGGPKNSFHCPHVNCKRHSGRGFSRQENLNEHLRRVHTQNSGPATAMNGTEGETDDAASDNMVAALSLGGGGGGQKRKRDDQPEDIDVREELKRVKIQNEELKKQVMAQNQQTSAMLNRINQLEKALAEKILIEKALVDKALAEQQQQQQQQQQLQPQQQLVQPAMI